MFLFYTPLGILENQTFPGVVVFFLGGGGGGRYEMGTLATYGLIFKVILCFIQKNQQSAKGTNSC